MLAVLIALLVAEALLESVLHATREQGLEPPRWEPDKAVPFALNAAVVVIAAPIVEELTFRGLGIAVLSRWGSLVALVGTSVAFAAAHGLVDGFPALFLFGATVAFLRLRTGSLYPGMLLHGTFNALALAVAFAKWCNMRTVRRAAIFVTAMVFAPAAHAAPPAVSAHASPANCPAPLQVTLTASGDLAAYHWELGDGATADGPSVQHVYAAGRFTARVTATSPTGETAQAAVEVTSVGLTLAAPRVGRYQQKLRFHGRLVPGLKGVRVGLYRGERRIAAVRTGKGGEFFMRGRVGTPDLRYTVRYAGAVSNAIALGVRPGLDTAFRGSGQLGHPLSFFARARPASAGTLTVRVWRGKRLVKTRSGRGRLRLALSTGRVGAYRVSVSLAPEAGYVVARRALERIVFLPTLSAGSAGASVRARPPAGRAPLRAEPGGRRTSATTTWTR